MSEPSSNSVTNEEVEVTALDARLEPNRRAARERNLRNLREAAFKQGMLDAQWRAREISAGRL